MEHHSRKHLDNHPNPDQPNPAENFQLEETNYTMTSDGHGGEETAGLIHGDRQSPRWSLSQSQDSSDKPHVYVYASDTVDSGTSIRDGQKASVDYGTSHSPPPPSSTHRTPQWSLSTQSPPEKPRVFMSDAMDDQETNSEEDGTKL